MRLNKFVALLLTALCICTSLSLPASAAPDTDTVIEDEDFVEGYQIAINPKSLLDINGTTATCKSKVESVNAERIGVLQVLQKWGGLSVGYVDVPHANWITCVFRPYVTFSNTFSGLSAGTYRVKSVFTLYENGNREEITIYSATKTVS